MSVDDPIDGAGAPPPPGWKASERVATALADVFLPARARPGERTRIALARLLARLVGEVEAGLGLLVDPAHGDAPLPPPAARAAPRMEQARLLHDPELVAALLRRIDEHVLSETLRLRAAEEALHAEGAIRVDTLQALAGERRTAPEIADAARDCLAAEGRRGDMMGEPLIEWAELPDAVLNRLIWRCAAVLAELSVRSGEFDRAEADRQWAAGAAALVARPVEQLSLPAAALRLAHGIMGARGRIDDRLIADAITDGHVAAGFALLAVRAEVPYEAIADMVGDGDAGPLAMLLRGIGVARAEAAEIAFALLVPGAIDERGEAVAKIFGNYHTIRPAEAARALAGWRLDPAYRRAQAELGRGLADGPGPLR